MTRPTGWQQEPVEPTTRPACPHFGLITAVFSIQRHAEGHEWICSCGQVFVVVSNGGQNKRLEKREKN